MNLPIENFDAYAFSKQPGYHEPTVRKEFAKAVHFCPECGILPFRRPSDPTPEQLLEGTIPFDGWAVNVRCLKGVDLDSIPIKKVYGSRIKHSL